MPARSTRKTKLARYLRKNPTVAEAQAWEYLRKLDGFHFRRQAPVGRYILDFYSAKSRLGVEIDGPFHTFDADAERTAWLKKKGVRLLRFPAEGFDPERMVRDILGGG